MSKFSFQNKHVGILSIFCLFILLFCLSKFCFTAEERLTLTTYYPAPYGFYRWMRVDGMSVGPGYRYSDITNGTFIVEGSASIGTSIAGKSPSPGRLSVAGKPVDIPPGGPCPPGYDWYDDNANTLIDSDECKKTGLLIAESGQVAMGTTQITPTTPTTLYVGGTAGQISLVKTGDPSNPAYWNIGTRGPGEPGHFSLSKSDASGGNLESRVFVDWNNGNIGINTTQPNTNLTIYNPNESTNVFDFSTKLTNAGINIVTDYTANAYTPGIFWSTADNHPTKPKAGIQLIETGGGTGLYLSTSSNYSWGITSGGIHKLTGRLC